MKEKTLLTFGRLGIRSASYRDLIVVKYRQAGRQTDRQADRQTGRQADRQTGRQAGRQADIQTDRQAGSRQAV